jgi:hypothetical protein
MVESVRKTATNPVEIVVYIDEDDLGSIDSAKSLGLLYKVGSRIRNITQAWNELLPLATGEIYQQGNDDIVFVTPGWDVAVEKAFEEVDDKIILVHLNDVFGHGGMFGPHSFVHKTWTDCLGYFIPPYYCSDFGDAHICELADMLGRRRFLPFDIEHHHFSMLGFEPDENTRERLQRHVEDNPDAIYYSREKVNERQEDAGKLARLMTSKVDNSKWVPSRAGVRSRGKCPKCESLSTVRVKGIIACNGCGATWEPPQ